MLNAMFDVTFKNSLNLFWYHEFLMVTNQTYTPYSYSYYSIFSIDDLLNKDTCTWHDICDPLSCTKWKPAQQNHQLRLLRIQTNLLTVRAQPQRHTHAHTHSHTHGFSLMTCLTAAVSRSSTEDEILLQLAFHDAFNRITLPSQV